MPRPHALHWISESPGYLRVIDQRALPADLQFIDVNSVQLAFEAIKTLTVRGAPTIGITAAYAMAIAANALPDNLPIAAAMTELQKSGEYLKSSRPTAVNLAWAVDRVLKTLTGNRPGNVAALRQSTLQIARAIHDEDVQMSASIARHGVPLIPTGGILTHCNTGYLAAGGDGTALGILYEANRRGVKFQVFADETRPLLQGSRLTAWELMQEGINVTVLVDSAAAMLMAQKKIQLAIVGADRITANGDVANKIGTYSVATVAAAHDIPFVVAAPSSTFDLSLASGDLIPIEERAASEVIRGFGKLTGPENAKVYNPAFDVTPASLIHAIVTERGVISPVNESTVRAVLGNASQATASKK